MKPRDTAKLIGIPPNVRDDQELRGGCDAMGEMAKWARALCYAQKGRSIFHGIDTRSDICPAAAADAQGLREYLIVAQSQLPP